MATGIFYPLPFELLRLVFFYFLKMVIPRIPNKSIRTRKMKNNVLATDAAPSAIPVKPKIAATMAIKKKVAAHLSMIVVY